MAWETAVQSQVEVSKDLKVVLDAALLNTQHDKVRVKGSNPRNGIAPSLTLWCSSY